MAFTTKRPKECMDSLDLITFLNGIKLYDKRCRLTNLLFRLLFVAYNYFHLLKNSYVLASELNSENMRKFIYISVHLTAIISHHHFLRNSKAIRQLFKSIVALLQAEGRRKLRRTGKRGLLVWFLGISWGAASGALRWHRYGTSVFLKEEYLLSETTIQDLGHLSFLLVAADILLFNVLSIGWYLGTVVIYGFLLIAMGRLNEVYFDEYGSAKALKETRSFTSFFRSLRIVWRRISGIKEEFDEIFGIQPFLWFVCLFIECSLTLILFKYEYVIYAQQSIATIFIDNWSLYFLRALFVFGVAFVVEGVNSRVTKRSRAFKGLLLEQYQRKEARLEVQALMGEIRESVVLQLSCWGTFKLNKTAILMFVNAVIPFSVLVLELTETITKSRASAAAASSL